MSKNSLPDDALIAVCASVSTAAAKLNSNPDDVLALVALCEALVYFGDKHAEAFQAATEIMDARAR